MSKGMSKMGADWFVGMSFIAGEYLYTYNEDLRAYRPSKVEDEVESLYVRFNEEYDCNIFKMYNSVFIKVFIEGYADFDIVLNTEENTVDDLLKFCKRVVIDYVFAIDLYFEDVIDEKQLTEIKEKVFDTLNRMKDL